MPSHVFRVGTLIQSSQIVLQDACLELSDDGTTVLDAIPWKASRFRDSDPHNYIDLSDQVLIPSLVNAHCHLEFSDLLQPFESQDGSFANWIQQVISSRFGKQNADNAAAQKQQAVDVGLKETVNCGSAAIGEIATTPFAAVRTDALSCTHFLEVLSLDRTRATAAIQWANETAKKHSSLTFGISPHAPYSTSTWLYQQAAGFANKHKVPLATHLAESTDELQLLESRSGPLVELFRSMNVWNPDEIQTHCAEEIIRQLSHVDHVLLIHCNLLLQKQWQQIPREKNWSVVYCPQTHQHFQHPTHPWATMIKDGINVALGTDSKASSNSLDLWDDLVVACSQHPNECPSQVLKMATENSALALGLSDRLGTITAGRSAKLLKANCENPFTWEMLPTLTPTPLRLPTEQ